MSEEDKLIELIKDEISLEHFKGGVKDKPIPRQGFQNSKDLDIFARYQRLQQKPEVKEMNELISRVNTLNREPNLQQQPSSKETDTKIAKKNEDLVNENTQKKSTLPSSTPDELKKLWVEFKLDDVKDEPTGEEDVDDFDDLEDLLDEDDFLESYIDKL